MISKRRNGTILDIIDRVSLVCIWNSLIRNCIYFECFFEANYSIYSCRMNAQTSFILKSLTPITKIKRIFSFKYIFTDPGTFVKFFEILFGKFETFCLCFWSWRKITSANIYLSRYQIILDCVRIFYLFITYSAFSLKILYNTINLKIYTILKHIHYFSTMIDF